MTPTERREAVVRRLAVESSIVRPMFIDGRVGSMVRRPLTAIEVVERATRAWGSAIAELTSPDPSISSSLFSSTNSQEGAKQ